MRIRFCRRSGTNVITQDHEEWKDDQYFWQAEFDFETFPPTLVGGQPSDYRSLLTGLEKAIVIPENAPRFFLTRWGSLIKTAGLEVIFQGPALT